VLQHDLEKLARRTLIIRCQLGDECAFERLVRTYHARLRYFVRQLVASPDTADDVLQEVWVAVFRKIASLREADAFVTWLYRIARHKAYHAIRRPQHVHLAEDQNVPGPEDNEPCEFVQLNDALGLLQPEHREVLILRYFEEMHYSAIAEALACPVGTVRSRLHVAKMRLRERIERTRHHEE